MLSSNTKPRSTQRQAARPHWANVTRAWPVRWGERRDHRGEIFLVGYRASHLWLIGGDCRWRHGLIQRPGELLQDSRSSPTLISHGKLDGSEVARIAIELNPALPVIYMMAQPAVVSAPKVRLSKVRHERSSRGAHQPYQY